MATLSSIYNLIQNNVTPSSTADRITSSELRAVLNAFWAEFLLRGVSQLTDSAQFATLENSECKICYLQGVGFFKDSATGTIDGVSTFAGVGGRFWVLITAEQIDPLRFSLDADGSIIIPAGKVATMIIITPVAQTNGLKVGTSGGGNEILMDQDIAANEDYPISTVVVARANKTLYFTGIADTTAILVYTKSL